jgi:hypothetical protein
MGKRGKIAREMIRKCCEKLGYGENMGKQGA